MKLLIFFLFFLSLASAGQIKIQTVPSKALVSIHYGANETPIGASPIALNAERLKDSQTIMISKPGYTSVHIPILKGMVEDSFALRINLKKLDETDLSAMAKRKIITSAQEVVDEIFFAQDLLANKNTEAALPKIYELQSKYPEIFAIKILHANALLLEGKKSQAYGIYSSVLESLPSNRTFMKKQVQAVCDELKTRIPASERN